MEKVPELDVVSKVIFYFYFLQGNLKGSSVVSFIINMHMHKFVSDKKTDTLGKLLNVGMFMFLNS